MILNLTAAVAMLLAPTLQAQGDPPGCKGPYGELDLLVLSAVTPGDRLLFVLRSCGVKEPWSNELELQLKGVLRVNPDLKPVTVDQVLAEFRRLTAPARKRGDIFSNLKDGQRYVWIPPGKYRMGCSPGDPCESDEEPVRDVVIEKGFWLGETEVAQEAWQKVLGIGNNPSSFKGDKRPVDRVLWKDAKRFCEAIGGRLPWEAEWEYAARAGVLGGRYGPLEAIAWYDANSVKQTHDVKGKAPNAFGLYDMFGNVFEWVEDWYDQGWYAKAKGTVGPSVGITGLSERFPSGFRHLKVARGGSWDASASYARASDRVREYPDQRAGSYGFRCAGDWP